MKKIELSKGLFAKVSDQDYARLSKMNWCASYNGRRDKVYARNEKRINGKIKRTYMHRLIKGVSSKNLLVDHKNGDTLDNRRSNLRKATPKQNSSHKTTLSAHNTTGYRGVRRYGEKFRAYIYQGNRCIYLGTFGTPQEAAKVFDRAAKRLFGKFHGKLNFGRSK